MSARGKSARSQETIYLRFCRETCSSFLDGAYTEHAALHCYASRMNISAVVFNLPLSVHVARTTRTHVRKDRNLVATITRDFEFTLERQSTKTIRAIFTDSTSLLRRRDFKMCFANIKQCIQITNYLSKKFKFSYAAACYLLIP